MLNFLASFLLVRLCALKCRFHIYFGTDFSVESGWAEPMMFLEQMYLKIKKLPMTRLNGSSQVAEKALL